MEGARDLPSTRERMAGAEVRSAERQRFERLEAMIERRRRPMAVWWESARSP